jgi:hypothetical protein
MDQHMDANGMDDDNENGFYDIRTLIQNVDEHILDLGSDSHIMEALDDTMIPMIWMTLVNSRQMNW